MRQVGTNICQAITPIIGLCVVYVFRYLGTTSLDLINGKSMYIPIPFIFNLPLKPFSTFNPYFNISDCNQWYLYQFSEHADDETKTFWGQN